MKIWKYSGTLLTVTGILHTIVALFINGHTYKEMIVKGLNYDDYRQAFALWFFICGIFLIIFGETLQYYIRKENKPAPLFLGYSLFIFSIIGCFTLPVSGFWLFIPQAVIIIVANYRNDKTAKIKF